MSKILDVDSKMLELWFFMIIGIVLEAIANIFGYLAQKEKNSRLEPRLERLEVCETTTFPRFQNKKFALKNPTVAPIGFRTEPEPKNLETSISNEDYTNYIDYMYYKQKNGYAPGYLDIARNVNIAVETARAIKGELQRQGIIKTVGNRTRIIKEV
jgi:hypothetical protein